MTLPRRIPLHLQEAFLVQQLHQAKLSINLTKKKSHGKTALADAAGPNSRKRKFDGAAKSASADSGASEKKGGTVLLWEWISQHLTRPYPTKSEKAELCEKTGMTKTQLRNFFTNVRKRHFKPVLKRGRRPRSELELAILEANRSRTPLVQNRSQRIMPAQHCAPQPIIGVHAQCGYERHLEAQPNCDSTANRKDCHEQIQTIKSTHITV